MNQTFSKIFLSFYIYLRGELRSFHSLEMWNLFSLLIRYIEVPPVPLSRTSLHCSRNPIFTVPTHNISKRIVMIMNHKGRMIIIYKHLDLSCKTVDGGLKVGNCINLFGIPRTSNPYVFILKFICSILILFTFVRHFSSGLRGSFLRN